MPWLYDESAQGRSNGHAVKRCLPAMTQAHPLSRSCAQLSPELQLKTFFIFFFFIWGDATTFSLAVFDRCLIHYFCFFIFIKQCFPMFFCNVSSVDFFFSFCFSSFVLRLSFSDGIVSLALLFSGARLVNLSQFFSFSLFRSWP